MSQYNKVKGTFFLKGTTFVYVLSSDWLNYWFDTQRATKLASLTLYWPYFYSLGNINHKKPHKVCGCLIFASISVQMQRYPLEDF